MSNPYPEWQWERYVSQPCAGTVCLRLPLPTTEEPQPHPLPVVQGSLHTILCCDDQTGPLDWLTWETSSS